MTPVYFVAVYWSRLPQYAMDITCVTNFLIVGAMTSQ